MSLSRRFGLFTLAATVTFSTAVFAAPTFINILTGGTSGVYYPIGVGLSQIYGHDIQGAKTSVQATKARSRTSTCCRPGVENWRWRWATRSQTPGTGSPTPASRRR